MLAAPRKRGGNTDSQTLCIHPGVFTEFVGVYIEFVGVYIEFVGVYIEFVNQFVLSAHIEQPCITKEREKLTHRNVCRHPQLIERMLAIKQPYNVNVAAEAMARSGVWMCEGSCVCV